MFNEVEEGKTTSDMVTAEDQYYNCYGLLVMLNCYGNRYGNGYSYRHGDRYGKRYGKRHGNRHGNG